MMRKCNHGDLMSIKMYINEQSMCKGFLFFRQCVLFVHVIIVKDLFKKYFTA